MKISIYLGSSLHCLPQYHTLAYEVGRKVAQAGHTIVYGGADVGTMKDIADGAQDAGGDVIGVFPREFKGTKEVQDSGVKVVRDNLTEMIYVADFAERKKVMESLSDACIILPGSFGTLDELFTYACNHAIGEHSKPVFLLNHEGFYTPLQQLMQNIEKGRFLKPETVAILTFCDTIDQIISILAATR